VSWTTAGDILEAAAVSRVRRLFDAVRLAVQHAAGDTRASSAGHDRPGRTAGTPTRRQAATPQTVRYTTIRYRYDKKVKVAHTRLPSAGFRS